MITEIVIFLLITILTNFLYVYKKIHWHYDNSGVKYLPGWPIFGNIIKNTFLKRHITEEIDEVYRAFPDARYVGFIETTTPTLIIRDPDIMKAITVKDFDHFENRKDLFASESDNGLFGSSLVMLKGDKWRDMRSTLRPAFTGSKMRTMMPSMIQISKNIVEYLKEWKENELASQVFQFFAAGFESTGSTLILGIHELALNPDVEEKLYQEVKNFKESKGELKYENLAELNYLDCVLNEINRKWSVGIFMDRVCTKTYVLPPPMEGGKPYTIKPGDGVYNVLNSIHMDPKYHPNPEKFDPDRFSDENKHNIKPFTFMPFGMGPRNCIGARLAIMELKVLLYYLTLNYKIVKCEKTSVPIKLMTRDISFRAVGGSWVKFEARI